MRSMVEGSGAAQYPSTAFGGPPPHVFGAGRSFN